MRLDQNLSMTRGKLLAWFGIVLALSVYSRWHTRHAGRDRCGLDGSRITPVYRVDLMEDGDPVASFCSIKCAVEWPDVSSVAYWRVRDEMTGQPLDARKAAFVESSVVTVQSRQNRTHVFKQRTDAMAHAAEYDGHQVVNPLLIGAVRVDVPD